MLKNKKHLPTYPDGWVYIYREKDRKTDFGAPRNVNVLDDMIPLVKLAFAEQSSRQQDFDFAQQQGFTLSKKVRTIKHAMVDSECKAVIGDDLYDIAHMDTTRTEAYLYLEGVRKIGNS